MNADLVEIAVVAVQSVVAQTNDRLDATLGKHRLTQATAQALWAINPNEDTPSMKTMAQRLFCNAPNLTFVVDQLTERGLVERIVDPNDRRSRLVRLTDEGYCVRSEIVAAAVANSPLGRLGPTDLQQLTRVLTSALDASTTVE